MDEALREELLERVNSRTATIGASVPDTVTIDGADLDLSEFIVETRAIDAIPPTVDEKVAAATATLRAERERRIERLRGASDSGDDGDNAGDDGDDGDNAGDADDGDPLDRETAEALADEIIGIDRALNALATIRHPDFADEYDAAALDGHERWLAFVDQVQ